MLGFQYHKKEITYKILLIKNITITGNFEVSMAVLAGLLLFENQRNDDFRDKGVVILAPGS